jgi:hypothetical protein
MPFGWGMLSTFPIKPLQDRHPTNFRLGESEQAYQQANNDDDVNEASFGHEALAGAASFGAFKMYEDRQRKEGMYS